MLKLEKQLNKISIHEKRYYSKKLSYSVVWSKLIRSSISSRKQPGTLNYMILQETLTKLNLKWHVCIYVCMHVCFYVKRIIRNNIVHFFNRVGNFTWKWEIRLERIFAKYWIKLGKNKTRKEEYSRKFETKDKNANVSNFLSFLVKQIENKLENIIVS